MRIRPPIAAGAAIALACSSALAVGAPAAALTVAIAPLISRLASVDQPPTEEQCEAAFTVPCYVPSELETAYNEQPLFARGITGRGETIVIVDAFGSPTIASDLATFDSETGLPDPPSLKIIQPAGKVTFDPNGPDEDGWAVETSLDVEWAHSIAPGANILLVETPVDEVEGLTGLPQIVEAENYVINHHLGDVITQSFGATEQTFPNARSVYDLRSAYLNAAAHRVTVLASSGDDGASDYIDADATQLATFPVTSWPASDPLVTSVGGTQLSLDDSGQRTAPDVVWNDTFNTSLGEALFGSPGPNPAASGGGKSIFFSRPAFQNGVARVVGRHRGVPDISMSGACNGLVTLYLSTPGLQAGWYVECGTSEASPLFAGIVALSDQAAHHDLGLINPALYQLKAAHAPGLVPVLSGNNTVAFIQDGQEYTVQGFSAGPGYNLAVGLGTVNAAEFVPELAAAAGRR